MSSLDRVVTRVREALENGLPWYDRDTEQAAERRTESIRRRSIALRQSNERLLAAHRVGSYARVRIHR